jgi:Entner-Doudoroff aldolase
MNHAPRHSDQRLDAALAETPLIAILRGIPTSDAVLVVQALFDAGIRVAEVPLNSPTPFDTIRLLVEHFGKDMVIGAGTVTRPAEVRQLAECGALLCVSPNTNPEVIAEALRLGMSPVPGFQTPTEAFAALAAGARHIKLFPATGRANDLLALTAVLPPDARVVAVGGVTPLNLATFRAAGATSFGVGSDMYRKGASAAAVGAKAQTWVAACRESNGRPT